MKQLYINADVFTFETRTQQKLPSGEALPVT